MHTTAKGAAPRVHVVVDSPEGGLLFGSLTPHRQFPAGPTRTDLGMLSLERGTCPPRDLHQDVSQANRGTTKGEDENESI